MTYNSVWKVRKSLESFLLGRGNDRIKYLPDIVARLERNGHYCKYGTLTAREMRCLKRDVLKNEHRLKYKKSAIKPVFNDSLIDYSMIKDGCKYLSWLFFASNTAMAQASVMTEPNSEAGFTFGYSMHQGVLGLEVTCDADRKVLPRAFM